MAETFRIAPASTDAELAAVRKLCWAYRDFLLNFAPIERELTETFYPVPAYEALMESLEAEHARPQGIIFLATLDGAPVGCGMSHRIDAQTSEIKRLFVIDSARGQGIARALCTALLDQAQTDGFEHVVLDTSKALTAARKLYASLGFADRGPYQPVPVAVLPHLCFFEINLNDIIVC